MSSNRCLLAVGAGLFALMCSLSVLAQEGEIQAEIGQKSSSAATRDLKSQAEAEPPRSTDPQELAIFYHKRGKARSSLGDYARAIGDLRIALEHVQPRRPSVDGWGIRTRIENDLGEALESNSEWFAAVDHWKQVAFNQQSNLGQYRYALQRLSTAYSLLGDFVQAENSLKLANDMLSKLRSTSGWAVWGFNYLQHGSAYDARFLESQGRHGEAEPKWRMALSYAEKDRELKIQHFGAGHQYTRGAEQNLAGIMRAFASNLATRGKYGEADILARESLRAHLRLYTFNTTAVSSVLSTVGWARFQQGDMEDAGKYYRYALAAAEGAKVAPHSTGLAARRASLGNVLVVQSRWDEAIAMFEQRNAGLRSNPELFKRVGSRHVSWAYALLKSGQQQRAAQMAGSLVATELRHPMPNEWALAQRRGVLGMALAATGKSGEALRAFQEAIPGLMRRDQGEDEAEGGGYSRVFWQRAILEGYLDLLTGLYGTDAAPQGLDLVDESFRVADMARGSSVQEAIAATAARAQLPDRDLAALARREQDALGRAAALNRLLARLAAAPEDQRLGKVIADMRAEIERLGKEHAELRADIRKRFPEYAELTDPKPAALDEVRKALAPGEALVAIYVGNSRSYVWTIVAGGKSAFHSVAMTRAEVERNVRELRRALDLGDGNPARLRAFDFVNAYKLYRAFFEADEALWSDAKALNVVPHGALGQLPMGLLVTAAPTAQGEAAYGSAPWLIRKVAISQLPSANAFVALRRAPAGKPQREAFIGFGDPAFRADSGGQTGAVRNLVIRNAIDRTDEYLQVARRGGGDLPEAAAVTGLRQAFALMSTLPDTSVELQEIAAALKANPGRDLFLNRQATEKNVKQAGLDNRRVVAFATHGIAPGEITGLEQPALALANPALTGDADNDGFLTMEEVLELKLDADWVVLSACNTASADGRGSEAVSGLGRAFFYAGARSLLVSNWAVETTSARLLTTEIFKRQAADPNLTRAEALRQSMLDIMGKKGPQGFSYAHPAFWAPFSLVGDGGR